MKNHYILLAALLLLPILCFSQTTITATIPHYGATASGTYQIYPKTGNGNPGEITRPVIIVEGIDFFEDISEDDVYDRLNTAESLFLGDDLRSQGYDIIILNYEDSGEPIQQNAFLVVALIDQINSMKVGDEENVVVGISMGGLVTRYALGRYWKPLIISTLAGVPMT